MRHNLVAATMYGSPTPFNFTNWVFDSVYDDDPVYWSPPHNNHPSAGGNLFYVEDDPGPALSTETGCVYSVDFEIGIYCTNQVPTTGASAQVNIGTPFSSATWDYKVMITTNGTFNHP